MKLIVVFVLCLNFNYVEDDMEFESSEYCHSSTYFPVVLLLLLIGRLVIGPALSFALFARFWPASQHSGFSLVLSATLT